MGEADTVHAVERALGRLGIGGLVFIAWTTVLCVALLRDEETFLGSHWDVLYRTWVALAFIWLVIAGITAAWERRAAPPGPQPGGGGGGPRIPELASGSPAAANPAPGTAEGEAAVEILKGLKVKSFKIGDIGGFAPDDPAPPPKGHRRRK